MLSSPTLTRLNANVVDFSIKGLRTEELKEMLFRLTTELKNPSFSSTSRSSSSHGRREDTSFDRTKLAKNIAIEITGRLQLPIVIEGRERAS